MSFQRNLQAEGGGYRYSTSDGNNFKNGNRKRSRNDYNHRNYNIFSNNHCAEAEHGGNPNFYSFDHASYSRHNGAPSHLKRRKYSAPNRGHSLPSTVQGNVSSSRNFQAPPTRSNADDSMSSSCKPKRSMFEYEEPVLMTRDEIDRFSPSRKDGIDVVYETRLRYSYCAFIQNLGMRLELPQITIGTAMVLCHRFYLRRSHARHDRFLIATAALFLAGKSEETPRPLNNVLRASSEILYRQDMLPYLLPVDWFEKYHDGILEAELLILTTLNFELNVQHPYAPLTSILKKLGPSMTVLVNLAINLINEGLRSSLWLQFKPHHIAAGAAYLASKFLNIDLSAYHHIWQEFQASPAILRDVSRQLMELF